MKATTLLAIGLCAALGTGFLHARTWTSADGLNTFDGEFVSYDGDAAKVTVTKKNGRAMAFSVDKLSEEDRAWIKTAQQAVDAKAAAGDIADQKIGGKLLSSGAVKRLLNDRFADYEFTRAPEYYLLYFSGSW